jgi:hypothetical protein
VDKILSLVDDEDKDVSKSALSNLSKVLQQEDSHDKLTHKMEEFTDVNIQPAPF